MTLFNLVVDEAEETTSVPDATYKDAKVILADAVYSPRERFYLLNSGGGAFIDDRGELYYTYELKNVSVIVGAS